MEEFDNYMKARREALVGTGDHVTPERKNLDRAIAAARHVNKVVQEAGFEVVVPGVYCRVGVDVDVEWFCKEPHHYELIVMLPEDTTEPCTGYGYPSKGFGTFKYEGKLEDIQVKLLKWFLSGFRSCVVVKDAV